MDTPPQPPPFGQPPPPAYPPPPAGPMPPPPYPSAGPYLNYHLPPPPLDIGRCFSDAFSVLGKNFWWLLLAGFLFQLLMPLSLFILTGPLYGGACMMCVAALLRPDRKVQFGDMFVMKPFWALVGMFFLTTPAILLGYVLLLVPGVMLGTIWMFCFLILMDYRVGVFQSLKVSYAIVRQRGFGINFLFNLVLLAVTILPSFVPFIGSLLTFIVTPFCWLLTAAAYIQEVREQSVDLTGVIPQGFPVILTGSGQTPT